MSSDSTRANVVKNCRRQWNWRRCWRCHKNRWKRSCHLLLWFGLIASCPDVLTATAVLRMTCVRSSSSTSCLKEISPSADGTADRDVGGARADGPRSPRHWRSKTSTFPVHVSTCRFESTLVDKHFVKLGGNQHRLRRRCIGQRAPTCLALSSNKAETSQWPTWTSRPSGALPPKPNGCVGTCNSIVPHGFTFATSRTMKRARKGTWPTDALPLLDASQKTLSTTVHFTTRCLHPVARLGADELQKSRSLESCFRVLSVWHVRRMVS